MPSEEFLSVEQTAELLSIDASTILRELNDGRLPGRKVGRAWRVPRAALDRYLTHRGDPYMGIMDAHHRVRNADDIDGAIVALVACAGFPDVPDMVKLAMTKRLAFLVVGAATDDPEMAERARWGADEEQCGIEYIGRSSYGQVSIPFEWDRMVAEFVQAVRRRNEREPRSAHQLAYLSAAMKAALGDEYRGQFLSRTVPGQQALALKVKGAALRIEGLSPEVREAFERWPDVEWLRKTELWLTFAQPKRLSPRRQLLTAFDRLGRALDALLRRPLQYFDPEELPDPGQPEGYCETYEALQERATTLEFAGPTRRYQPHRGNPTRLRREDMESMRKDLDEWIAMLRAPRGRSRQA